MTIKTKFGKNFVIFSVAIAIIIGMFGFSTKIYAKEFLNTEIINPPSFEDNLSIQSKLFSNHQCYWIFFMSIFFFSM